MNTLFGFDTIALALHGGNVGIKTGSVGRAAGKTHLFDATTGRTACGRAQNTMAVSLVPADLTESNWQVRIALCLGCRKHIGI